MKVCYVNPTNNIRRPIAELANILAQEGNQISIMFPVSKACPTKNWVANDAVRKGTIKLIPVNSWYFSPLRYNFPNILELIRKTRKLYREHDKVHIWEYFYPLSVVPLLYALLNPKRKRKLILTTDGFVGYSYKPKDPSWLVPAFKVYTQLFARFLFKIPKQMTTYGKAMVPYARKAGVPVSKLHVISTGIHLERFASPDVDKIEQLKKEFKIKNEKIIIFIGMLTERKGVDKVIKISQKLLDEGVDIKTLIVGDAHGDNFYPKLVSKKYKDKILFAGGRKEIPELMSLADVLLLPSEGEGLPGVVMEAMCSGLPVVATSEGCTPDLIETGKEGFLVGINDLAGYYYGVKRIITDEETANMFSTNSLLKIKNFHWKNVKEKYKQIYS